MSYYENRVNLWQQSVSADTDFGAFEPQEPGSCLHLSMVVDTSAVLTLRVYRDKGEPGETYVDMTLNAGQPLIAGALYQDELATMVLPGEDYAFRISAAAVVDKMLVTEVK